MATPVTARVRAASTPSSPPQARTVPLLVKDCSMMKVGGEPACCVMVVLMMTMPMIGSPIGAPSETMIALPTISEDQPRPERRGIL